MPAVAAVYPAGDAIWQDDPASIHRTRNALHACSAFAERIPHDVQAAKCSDIWPIEQVFVGKYIFTYLRPFGKVNRICCCYFVSLRAH